MLVRCVVAGRYAYGTKLQASKMSRQIAILFTIGECANQNSDCETFL